MSMREYDVIVVGTGPAGLFCAAHLAPAKVLILEKMKLPGRKLLLAGSGQCNLTHSGDVKTFTGNYGDHGNFVKPSLMACSNETVMDFFEHRGVPLFTNENDKVFPVSLRADDVLDALLDACDEAGVEIFYSEVVKSVAPNNGGYSVQTSLTAYQAKYVVIATGGMSYPGTGSTGDGYAFAESLGHTIVLPEPSLTPVYVDDHLLWDLSGISLPAKVSIWHEGKKLMTREGDLLITRFGYSGPVILDASRWMRAGDQLRIAFTPLSPEEVDTLLKERTAESGGKQIQNLLSGLSCPDRLTRALVEISGIPEGTTGGQLTSKMRGALVENLTGFPVIVERVGDFGVAMCTAGGVPLAEINKKTCESKIAPGIFFAGEVMDIDGDTGGYNIQAAFSTGFVAAKTILRMLCA
ncbi:MAG: NAD(P)/FAD-dependent oxidoreductase [Methanocorpusculum sp.]|uniref:NAD(P)/FAD-dependent oxidoreductase n=1 Tax=Methanocorpusculum sp. TaxID=2058474 RepID=UPI002727732F|nr:NAD(P)/FAD-dependent oxidoreductase [Methanocorpusculum sp.]MDO9523244.1 NAD(P)/FAD-dependent oxidoreductase [Methanocorpusculum sp.]